MPLPPGWILNNEFKQSAGGQADIFPVRRSDSTETFALKRLKNPARRQRFEREVQTMSELWEKGVRVIPPVVEQNLTDARPHFVMPWYANGSIERLIEAGEYKGQPSAALPLATAIGAAIAQLHELGVAHRDIKPENIFLTPSGVILGDLGLCMATDSDFTRLTEPPEAVGSRLYIAPENESGINEDEDQRPADIYAFGKVLWSLLAGRRPFAREDFRSSEWRLSALCGDSRLDRLDSLFGMLLSPDVRVRGRVTWNEIQAELSALAIVFGNPPTLDMAPPPRTTLDVARAFAQRQDVVARRREADRFGAASNWMNLHIPTLISDRLNSLHRSLRSIEEASGKEFTLWVSTQWHSHQVENFFPEFHLIPGTPARQTLDAVLPHMVIDSSGGQPMLDMFFWARTDADAIRVASLPILYYAVDLGLPIRPLLAHRAVTSHLVPGRESSLREVEQLVVAQSDRFARLASRYVEMVTDDVDLIFGDPNVWNDI